VQTTHPSNSREFVFTKSVHLDEIPVVWKVYTELTNTWRINQVHGWIKKYEELVKKKYSEKNWREAPVFSGYIRLHNKYSQRKGLRSSSEKLIEFILKRDSVPNVNPFVDIYNVVSAYTGISIGAHDLDQITGDVCLEVLKEDTEFEMIGGGRYDIARKGEYSYLDERGILCRLDIKQSERTKVTEKTHDVLVIVQGHEYLREQLLRQGVHLLEEGICAMRI